MGLGVLFASILYPKEVGCRRCSKAYILYDCLLFSFHHLKFSNAMNATINMKISHGQRAS
jgi:hypothetical protein